MRYLLLIFPLLLMACQPKAEEVHKLSKWTDSTVRDAIVEFVETVTDKKSPNYVEVKDRVAVFDNDGTLWCEKPFYIPVEIELAYVKEYFFKNPEWQSDPLFSGIAEGDLSVFLGVSTAELIQKLFGAHEGQPEEEYKAFVYESLSSIIHSEHHRPLKEMTYAPMVQLVHYLQSHDFEVYIVTGGEITSVRTVSEEIYDIPKQNVIGSSVDYEYVVDENGKRIIRKGTINSANDKQVKPTNIELHIGRQPIFAAGNSNGDYEMMEYTLANPLPSMAILVNHDDEKREYHYMHGTEKAVEDAEEQGWYVVSMKNDFKVIF